MQGLRTPLKVGSKVAHPTPGTYSRDLCSVADVSHHTSSRGRCIYAEELEQLDSLVLAPGGRVEAVQETAVPLPGNSSSNSQHMLLLRTQAKWKAGNIKCVRAPAN